MEHKADSPYLLGNSRDALLRARAWRLLQRISQPLLLSLLLLQLLAHPTLAQEPSRLDIGPIESAEFPGVKVYLNVTDARGWPVLGLSASQFEAFEDGLRVDSLQVVQAVDAKASLGVALIIDASGSMKGQPIEDAKRVATDFVSSLQGKERVALLTVAKSGNIVQDFTADRDQAKTALSTLKAEGNTALYDAIQSALELAAGQGTWRGNVFILLSDGVDTTSKAGLDETLALLKQRDVTIFAVGFGANADMNVLKRLAEATGGASFQASSSADLSQAFQMIAARVGKYYLLTYTSPRPKGGQTRGLTMKVHLGANTLSGVRNFLVQGVAPSFSITSPQPEEMVLEQMPVVLAIDQPQQVAEAELWIDNRLIGKLTDPPFSWHIDTTSLPGGEHSLLVVVRGLGPGVVYKQLWFISTPPLRHPETTRPGTEVTEPGRLGWVKDLSRLAARAGLALLAFGLMAAGAGRLLALTGSKCPACGARYQPGRGCPACQAEGGAYSRPKRLGEMLVASGIIDASTLESALAAGRAMRKMLGEVLLNNSLNGTNATALRAAIRLQAVNSNLALRAAILAREREPQPLTAPMLAVCGMVLGLGVILAGISLAAPW